MIKIIIRHRKVKIDNILARGTTYLELLLFRRFGVSSIAMVHWHEAQVLLLQLFADILLRSSQTALLVRVSFATEQHVVDVGVDVVLNIDVVVPVLLRQLFRFVVRPRNVTNLALYILGPFFTLADLSAKDSANEHADEEEKEGNEGGLRRLLQKASWDLRIQNRKRIIFVAMEFDTNNLLHSLKKCLCSVFFLWKEAFVTRAPSCGVELTSLLGSVYLLRLKLHG